jgi:hypothetical protein
MSEERLGRLQRILHSLATRVPRVLLQRVEEMFPSLRETMVSVLCLFAQDRVFSFSSEDIQVQSNQIFCCKVVLIFMIYVVIYFMGGYRYYSGLMGR